MSKITIHTPDPVSNQDLSFSYFLDSLGLVQDYPGSIRSKRFLIFFGLEKILYYQNRSSKDTGKEFLSIEIYNEHTKAMKVVSQLQKMYNEVDIKIILKDEEIIRYY